MIQTRIVDDLKSCRQIWQKLWPVENIFDLWETRWCFAKSYDRPLCFIVAEENNSIVGVLPLSWIEEDKQFGYFPGETWQGKTWLEQNRMFSRDTHVSEELINSIPGKAHIRYLTEDTTRLLGSLTDFDENAYFFYPSRYNYSFDAYLNHFSGKSRKKLFGEISKLEEHKISYCYNKVEDMQHLFKMNTDRFGARSYFYNNRFTRAFEHLVDWLRCEGMLKIKTVLIGGVIGAIDIGIVHEKNYTLLAGGTNPEFPGVAKLINLHHFEYACQEHFHQVECLCGDFGWKERFGLTGIPLYQISKKS